MSQHQSNSTVQMFNLAGQLPSRFSIQIRHIWKFTQLAPSCKLCNRRPDVWGGPTWRRQKGKLKNYIMLDSSTCVLLQNVNRLSQATQPPHLVRLL